MTAPKLRNVAVPSPGPWLVRGEGGNRPSPIAARCGAALAAAGQPSLGWPYFVQQGPPAVSGTFSLYLAQSAGRLTTDISRLADAKLMAAEPDLADGLLRLLVAPDLRQTHLDYRTQQAAATAWDLLVRVAPHLEI